MDIRLLVCLVVTSPGWLVVLAWSAGEPTTGTTVTTGTAVRAATSSSDSVTLATTVTTGTLSRSAAEPGPAKVVKEEYDFHRRQREGYRAARAGELDQAITIFVEIVERQPDYGRARVELARALLKKQRPREALPHARKATELVPRRASAHRTLGRCHQALGELTAARKAFEQATKCLPKSAWSYNNLGYCCLLLKDHAAAAAALRQAVELAPNNAMMWNSLGVALERQADRAGALAAFKRAVALDPSHQLASKNLQRMTD